MSRILSVKRIPKRCVLVLNSARCKSAAVGLGGDLPNIDRNPATSKPRNELTLCRTVILNARYLYIQKSKNRILRPCTRQVLKSETDSKFEFQTTKTLSFGFYILFIRYCFAPGVSDFEARPITDTLH